MKYIPLDKLIAKIDAKLEDLGMSGSVWVGRSVLNELKEDIESLQKEQPWVDFDFQVFTKEMDAVFNFPKEVTENTEENPLNWEYAIARHFYELGLNARKDDNQ